MRNDVITSRLVIEMLAAPTFVKGVRTGKIAWLVPGPYIPLRWHLCDSDSDVERW
jgi:hypothetical protein